MTRYQGFEEKERIRLRPIFFDMVGGKQLLYHGRGGDLIEVQSPKGANISNSFPVYLDYVTLENGLTYVEAVLDGGAKYAMESGHMLRGKSKSHTDGKIGLRFGLPDGKTLERVFCSTSKISSTLSLEFDAGFENGSKVKAEYSTNPVNIAKTSGDVLRLSVSGGIQSGKRPQTHYVEWYFEDKQLAMFGIEGDPVELLESVLHDLNERRYPKRLPQ